MTHLFLALLMCVRALAESATGSYGYPGPTNTARFIADSITSAGETAYTFCAGPADPWALTAPGVIFDNGECWTYSLRKDAR